MYTSTRKKLNIDASEAIIRGISEEGGLFIFHHIKPFYLIKILVYYLIKKWPKKF